MLVPDTIQIWRIPLGGVALGSATAMARWRSVLSAEELRRADSFHGEGHRWDYVMAHAGMRAVLARCLGIAPEAVVFAPGSIGGEGGAGSGPAKIKPVLAVHLVGESDIRFNLSHTNGVALVAVGLGRELGVDIEWHRPLEDLEAMARAVMSELELRQWLALDSEYRYVAFYHLWSRKESYLKAIGLGLYRNLHEVTVPISAERLDESGGRIHVVHDVSGEGRWQLRDVLASADYSASVCCEGVRPFAIEVEELDLGRD